MLFAVCTGTQFWRSLRTLCRAEKPALVGALRKHFYTGARRCSLNLEPPLLHDWKAKMSIQVYCYVSHSYIDSAQSTLFTLSWSPLRDFISKNESKSNLKVSFLPSLKSRLYDINHSCTIRTVSTSDALLQTSNSRFTRLGWENGNLNLKESSSVLPRLFFHIFSFSVFILVNNFFLSQVTETFGDVV